MIRVTGHSEPGGHPDNQDAYAFQPHPQDPDCLLAVVADGQGGRAGGARAARLGCNAVLVAAALTPPGLLAAPDTWPELLQRADGAVASDAEAGFTTLVGLAVRAGRVAGASCGDSGAALLRSGAASLVLTARQWKDPPVGSGSAVCVPFAAALTPPWTLLLLTDGVWKYASWQAILGRSPDGPADEVIRDLRRRATLPGSGGLQDDFTLVVIQSGD
jgi:serine/threonine protein phosphatase PrpC